MHNVETLLAMGAQNYTVLHHNVQIARQIHDAYPDSLLLLRFYLRDWNKRDPREWAREAARTYRRGWDDITRHVTPANEMNLAWEGGGATRAWYEQINRWLLAWADEFRKHVPEAVLHWPALAQGHQEDGRLPDGGELDWAGYSICGLSLDAYDVVDVHPYWGMGGHGLWDHESRWYAWRFVHDRERFFSDKPVFISEAGNFAVTAPTTPEEMVYFFQRLGEYPYVLGATPFIWHSGPEHKHNLWSRNPRIAEAVTRMFKPEFEMPEFRYEPPPPKGPQPKLHGWRTVYQDLPHADNPPLRAGATTARQSLNKVQALVFHHFGANMVQKPGNSYGDTVLRYLHTVAKRHHERLGWPSIGYSYVIDRRGVIWWTAPSKWETVHAGNRHYNDVGIGIAFPADHRTTPLTQRQKEAAAWLIRRLEAIVGRPLELTYHQEVRDEFTECPGDNVIEFVEELRNG